MILINDDDRLLVEMANVAGTVYDQDKNYEWRIFVNDSDRDHEPHFHVQCFDLNSSKAIYETRILLTKSSYYDNKDQLLPTGVLNDLVKVIEGPAPTKRFNGTAWEWMCDTFSTGLGNTKIDPDEVGMPNYRLLKSADFEI